MLEYKTCNTCGTTNPNTIDFYYTNPGLKSLRAKCKVCVMAKQKQWVDARPPGYITEKAKQHYERTKHQRQLKYQSTKERRRELHVLKVYGLDEATHKAMFDSHGGCCWICGRSQSEETKRLSVDHDHATGVVRGLLCQRCNRGLGMLGDNIECLARCIDYLETCSVRISEKERNSST